MGMLISFAIMVLVIGLARFVAVYLHGRKPSPIAATKVPQSMFFEGGYSGIGDGGGDPSLDGGHDHGGHGDGGSDCGGHH